MLPARWGPGPVGRKAVAVVRIVFLVEALGLIATILEEVIKGLAS